MILTLLAIAGLIAIPAITFLAGLMCAAWAFESDAPDLYAEWKNRRDDRRAGK